MYNLKTSFNEWVCENNSNLYFHGSKYNFTDFDNIDNNKAITIFGNKLNIKGNFITKNYKFAKIFIGEGGFIYTVKLLTDNIFSLNNKEHFELFENYIGSDNIKKYIEEEYIIDGLPSWDLYPVIEFAYNNGFDGIKLLEFSADISSDPIIRIMVFNPSDLIITNKEKI